MIVALGRVFHVWIDAAFEDLPEGRRLRRFAIGATSEMDVKEGRNVPKVEDALVAQINGLGE
jgi:hypothetical protein